MTRLISSTAWCRWLFAKKDYVYRLNAEERQRIFDYLNTNEKLTATTLLKLLGLKKSDGFVPDKAIGRGIKAMTLMSG